MSEPVATWRHCSSRSLKPVTIWLPVNALTNCAITAWQMHFQGCLFVHIHLWMVIYCSIYLLPSSEKHALFLADDSITNQTLPLLSAKISWKILFSAQINAGIRFMFKSTNDETITRNVNSCNLQGWCKTSWIRGFLLPDPLAMIMVMIVADRSQSAVHLKHSQQLLEPSIRVIAEPYCKSNTWFAWRRIFLYGVSHCLCCCSVFNETVVCRI